MAEIEPIATRLLESVTTALDGAEMVLGRRIDGKERDLAQIYLNPFLSASKKVGLLLMQRATEE